MTTPKKPVYLVSPPPLFTMLDERLSCCYTPFLKVNVTFIKSMGIERILNYSGKKLDSSIIELCTTDGIKVQDVNIDDPDFPKHQIPKFCEWLTISIEDIIAQSSHATTMIIGSFENHISSLVIACWRRVQDWSLVAILSEFRQFTWPHKLYDYEQLIEYFNISTVDLPTLAPEFHRIHCNLKEEEEKLLERYQQQREGGNDEDDEEEEDREGKEQRKIDETLYKLFFSPPNALISAEVEYDPNLSLVNDKDDDD